MVSKPLWIRSRLVPVIELMNCMHMWKFLENIFSSLAAIICLFHGYPLAIEILAATQWVKGMMKY